MKSLVTTILITTMLQASHSHAMLDWAYKLLKFQKEDSINKERPLIIRPAEASQDNRTLYDITCSSPNNIYECVTHPIDPNTIAAFCLMNNPRIKIATYSTSLQTKQEITLSSSIIQVPSISMNSKNIVAFKANPLIVSEDDTTELCNNVQLYSSTMKGTNIIDAPRVITANLHPAKNKIALCKDTYGNNTDVLDIDEKLLTTKLLFSVVHDARYDYQKPAWHPCADILAVSPNEKNERVVLWDSTTGKKIASWNHSSIVWKNSWDCNGSQLVSSFDNAEHQIHDASGTLLYTIHDSQDNTLKKHGNWQDNLLALWGNTTAKLWNSKAQKFQCTLHHEAPVRTVQVNPQHNLVISAQTNEKIQLWTKDGDHIRTIVARGEILDAKWNCDGSILYVLATSKNLHAGGVMLSPYLVQ